MALAENRSQLMELLGATQVNTVWAWCAVNESRRRVYLSVWSDLISKHEGKSRYLIQGPDWGVDEKGSRKPARNDQDEKLKLVFDQGYEPYAYFIDAVDPNQHPRKIGGIRTSFIMKVTLARTEDGCIYAYPVERIELQ